MSEIAPTKTERRQFGRRTTYKPALLVFNEQRLQCVAVDLSHTGARLERRNLEQLPERMMLMIPDDDFVVACRPVHQSESHCGVQFIGSPQRMSWHSRSMNERQSARRAAIRRSIELETENGSGGDID